MEARCCRWEGPTLCTLGDDLLCVVFEGLRNPLEPRFAVDFSSANRGLWAVTQALRQQLKAEYEAAAALCLKVGMRSCKELREAKEVYWDNTGLSAADLALLGTLGLVLPALKWLVMSETSAGAAGPDGVQRLVEGLDTGALPAVNGVLFVNIHVGDAGSSALAAALSRGALPQLKVLLLGGTGIGDAGLVTLAPALRRLPALDLLDLNGNPFGDEGLAALVAPSPPAGAPSPPIRGLTELRQLDLSRTQVTDAGCATIYSALDRGALPALRELHIFGRVLDRNFGTW